MTDRMSPGSMACFGRIGVEPARISGNSRSALSLKVKRTLLVSDLLHLRDGVQSRAEGNAAFSFRRLKVKITSSGVTGWPSDHLAAGLRLNWI